MLHHVYGPLVRDYFAHAGITINGSKPHDLRLTEKHAYAHMACNGTLGFGECFVNGSIQTKGLPELTEIIRRVLTADVRDTFMPAEVVMSLREKFTNQQTKARAKRVGAVHYDITPELYKHMLGKYMAYTCAYWDDGAKNLDEAQEDKFRLLCEKLHLKPGMKVLDIGCGYSTLAKFMAENYGVEVVGITISKGQLKMGQDLCAHLPGVTLLFLDYRDLPKEFHDGYFDRIVSVGMFEHVGFKNYHTFFKTARRMLEPKRGIFVLHSITGTKVSHNEGFHEKYIFPGGQLPPPGEVERISFKEHFLTWDMHEFGLSYAKTLHAWRDNFNAWWDSMPPQEQRALFGNSFPQYWGEFTPEERTLRFRRLWNYYLSMDEAVFLARHAMLNQWVMTTPQYEGEYDLGQKIRRVRHLSETYKPI